MVDFSDCSTARELDEALKQEAEDLATRHRENTKYDEPQFVLRDPHDEQLAEKQEAEFDEIVNLATERAKQILDESERRDKAPLWEYYAEAAGDYYANGW